MDSEEWQPRSTPGLQILDHPHTHLNLQVCVCVHVCIHTPPHTHKWGTQGISSHQPYALLRRDPRRWDDTHSCTAVESSATPHLQPTLSLQKPLLSVCPAKPRALCELSHLALIILNLCPGDPDTCQLICFPFQVHVYFVSLWTKTFCSVSVGFPLIINTAMCLNPGDTFYNPLADA